MSAFDTAQLPPKADLHRRWMSLWLMPKTSGMMLRGGSFIKKFSKYIHNNFDNISHI
jgi:hypothetical protein